MIDKILGYIGKIFFIILFLSMTVLTIYGVIYLGIKLLEWIKGAL